METFDFGNGSMARVLEALQSLHLPRYCAPLAFDALFLASLMAGEGCIIFNEFSDIRDDIFTYMRFLSIAEGGK